MGRPKGFKMSEESKLKSSQSQKGKRRKPAKIAVKPAKIAVKPAVVKKRADLFINDRYGLLKCLMSAIIHNGKIEEHGVLCGGKILKKYGRQALILYKKIFKSYKKFDRDNFNYYLNLYHAHELTDDVLNAKFIESIYWEWRIRPEISDAIYLIMEANPTESELIKQILKLVEW